MSACLSEFALDDLVLNGEGEANPEARFHLQDCADCRRRQEERLAYQRQFESQRAKAFWDGTRRAYLRRRNSRRALVLGIPCGLAAAFAFVLLARKEVPPADSYWGAKGIGSVEIHCRRAGRTFLLEEADPVKPGDELRFVPRPASPGLRYVQVGSIDGTDRYTPFYPSTREATSLPLPASGRPLDGSIRIDAAPGPERLFFVFSSTALPVPAVELVARRHVTDRQPVRDIAGVAVEGGWIILPKAGAASGEP
jgi:hypothetical protein